MTTILVTGFGRFPGAPFNPTEAIVAQLLRRRRPTLAGVRLVGHVFETRYAAVDRDLPALLAREKPDAIVLLGVATRADRMRLELTARNRVSVLFPDAGGARPARQTIAPGVSFFSRGMFPEAALRAALRSAGIDAALSKNAGGYLCNYAYWRALEAAAQPHGPRHVVFVHVPPLHRLGRTGTPPISRRCHVAQRRARFVAAIEQLLVAATASLR
ncbi:MAG: pyroglutamyl-peptidase I [Rhodoplanes sp.]|uniref:pyroglutamyl-peptidase I family protein n=1 Tax=Rhodoplanes sp. TaxID=1968906 RepID=UPI0018534FA2|nr:pyroglutamyl-peptidase I [Rhodoplanes sp.]NVO14716.1 pyroglutamyl-peptidase I [Rhodoplanes sp.]